MILPSLFGINFSPISSEKRNFSPWPASQALLLAMGQLPASCQAVEDCGMQQFEKSEMVLLTNAGMQDPGRP